MRRSRLFAIPAILLLILIFTAFAAYAAADDTINGDIDVEYMPDSDFVTDENGDETIDLSAYVWRIRHKDGTVDYSDKFAAFGTILEGDVFEFLPKGEYSLSKFNYASSTSDLAGAVDGTIRPSCDFTIDLRGATVTTPETGDIARNVMQISSTAPCTVTVLIEDAKLYASPEGRGFFYVNGDTQLIIDGGVRGGSIYAPATVNFETTHTDESRASRLINVDLYRISGNMAGCLCARKASRVILEDCTVIGSKGNLVTIRHTGELELYNTAVIATGTNIALDFTDVSSGAGLTVSNGSLIGGNITGYNASKCYFRADPTSYYTVDISSSANPKYLAKNGPELTFNYLIASAAKKNSVYTYSVKEENVTVKAAYTVTDSTLTSATPAENLPWKLTDKDGKVIYAASLAPLAVPHSYVSACLTESIEADRGISIVLTSDMSVCFGSTLYLSDYESPAPVFVLYGTGNAEFTFNAYACDMPSTAIYSHGSGNVTVSCDDYLAANTLVAADTADITLRGGYWYSHSGNAVRTGGNVTLDGASVSTDVEGARLIEAGGSVSLRSSVAVAPEDATALLAGGIATFTKSNTLRGRVSAQALDIDIFGRTAFSSAPKAQQTGDLIYSPQRIKVSLLVYIGEILVIDTVAVSVEYTNEVYELSSERNEDSIYEITLKDGSVKYASIMYAPFSYVSEYAEIRLLCDAELTQAIDVELSGDFTLDISGRRVVLAGGADTLIRATGVGVLTVVAENSTVLAPSAAVADVNALKGLNLTLTDSYVICERLAATKGAALTVTGGTVAAGGNAIAVSEGELVLTDTVIIGNGLGTLLTTDGDISMFGSAMLLADTGALALEAGGTLYAASGARVCGSTSILALSAEAGCRFSYVDQSIPSNMPIIRENYSDNVTAPSLEDGSILTSVRRYSYSYVTSPINRGLSVSLAFGTVTELNVYVPAAITELEGFRVRVMHQGILYDRDASAGRSVLVNGIGYKKFTYTYIYPTSYLSDISITLVSGGYVSVSVGTVESLVCASFERAESDRVKTLAATYAAYAAASLGVDLPEDTDMSDYVHKYSGKFGTGAGIGEYFSYARYDIISQQLVLGKPLVADARITVRYTFGSESLEYTFLPGESEISIPIYRLSATNNVNVIFTTESGWEDVSFDLFDVYAFAKDGTSARTYLGLLLAIYEARLEER